MFFSPKITGLTGSVSPLTTKSLVLVPSNYDSTETQRSISIRMILLKISTLCIKKINEIKKVLRFKIVNAIKKIGVLLG